jgi:PAS domain S-box-containing protein
VQIAESGLTRQAGVVPFFDIPKLHTVFVEERLKPSVDIGDDVQNDGRLGWCLMAEVLIVEDDPLLALDLGHEVEQLGYRVIGMAESADEAMIAYMEYRPDLVIMDIAIAGGTDGIQTAHMMNVASRVPVIFLTSSSDDTTMARAARESSYGYLVKPFKLPDLKAAIRFALHKAWADGRRDQGHAKMEEIVRSIPMAVLTLNLNHEVQFMNATAETMVGCTAAAAQGMKLYALLNLTDSRMHPLPDLDNARDAVPIEEFGCSLVKEGGTRTMVDVTITPLKDKSRHRTGFMVTMQEAAERLRSQAVEEALDEVDAFHMAPLPMVQMDSAGRIVRLNDAMIKKTGTDPALVVGRSLTAISMDSNPRIARDFLHNLLQSDTSVATGQPPRMH